MVLGAGKQVVAKQKCDGTRILGRLYPFVRRQEDAPNFNLLSFHLETPMVRKRTNRSSLLHCSHSSPNRRNVGTVVDHAYAPKDRVDVKYVLLGLINWAYRIKCEMSLQLDVSLWLGKISSRLGTFRRSGL